MRVATGRPHLIELRKIDVDDPAYGLGMPDGSRHASECVLAGRTIMRAEAITLRPVTALACCALPFSAR